MIDSVLITSVLCIFHGNILITKLYGAVRSRLPPITFNEFREMSRDITVSHA